MSALVLFDDIEAWAVSAIATALATRPEDYAQDVYVASSVPKDRTGPMVIVRRDGGGRLDVVREQPRLGIRVFGDNDADTDSLARLVAALLWASPDGDPVCKVSITGGPYRIPDESGEPLYYLTAELIARGKDYA